MNTNTFVKRREGLARWMRESGVDAAVIEDCEGRRSPSLRYLSGMPSDAYLVLFADAESVLVAWDVNLARKDATADRIVASGDYGRNFLDGVKAVVTEKGLSAGRIEVSAQAPYLQVKDLSAAMPGFEILCRSEGIDSKLLDMRARKDEAEIRNIREACAVTNAVLDTVAEGLSRGEYPTETDLALAIESLGRKLGAEGTGFDTIAAGPGRSWAIHAIPSYSGGSLLGDGLCIVDFGLKVGGYTSDVTFTRLNGRLSPGQRNLVDLVQSAYGLCVSMAKPGLRFRDLALAVDAHFAEHGKTMPHSLGHGIGLAAHEAPRLSPKAPDDSVLEPGMVFTIEPGLYDPDLGGVRLENDFLVTEDGVEVLTRSRILS